jgi:hypothetical protein
MIKVQWIQDSEISFENPVTHRREWYGSDMGRGTSMEFSDVISGNTKEIKLLCPDGEIGIVKTDAIRFI